MADTEPANFIEDIVEEHNGNGRFGGEVITRFPPEPNGYLHIGHAKSMCLNFGLADKYGGRCHMRFDDTNPAKEEEEFVESILEDVSWLGWDWGEHLYFASDYFDELHDYAIDLIKKGKAYVDDLDQEQIRKYRGTLTEPGVESPFRDRSVDDNLALFRGMKEGEFEEGTKVLRAKIDMASGNINMRDPVLFRILKTPHHRTGEHWVIYPMYDFTHGQSDSIEGVTHSICTMEYEDHRPLYDWFLDALDIYQPQQIEFARLNLSNTVLSKRKLIQLVREGHVGGWDDPRMPTLGWPSQARVHARVDSQLLRAGRGRQAAECHRHCDARTRRARRSEQARAPRSRRAQATKDGDRKLPGGSGRAPRRNQQSRGPRRRAPALCPSHESCTSSATTLWRTRPASSSVWPPAARCGCGTATSSRARTSSRTTPAKSSNSAAPTTRRLAAVRAPDGRRVRGTIHWVSAEHAVDAEVRLYEHLFTSERPDDDDDFMSTLNPDSMEIIPNAKVEPSLADALPGEKFQFERTGYFAVDPDSRPVALVFNRTVTLRDSWKKVAAKL